MNDLAYQVSTEALLRYQVVSEVRSRVLSGMPVGAAIEDVLQLEHTDLNGKSHRLSERTIYRWWKAFKEGGIVALERQQRNRVSDSQVLSEAMLSYLKAQKQLDPLASIPEIIRRAEDAGVIDRGEVNRACVWRACKRLGLPVLRPRQRADRDMRRYAHPHRMMMVLADGKHFRAGTARAKRVALTLLDDSTRFGLEVRVATSEKTEAFLAALSTVVRAMGLMICLFLDRGPGFIARDTRIVAARLGIHLIHGEKAYPEGHGKIERFNRTLKAQVLRGLDGNPSVDSDPAALTLRLNHWLKNVYNDTPHEGIGGDTPRGRWRCDERELEYPSDGWLRHFTITAKRKVTNDNVIAYGGEHYEVPLGSAGRYIEVKRHLLKGNALTVMRNDEEVRLHPVDLVANARSRRARPRTRTPAEQLSTPPRTAAAIAFDADTKPLVAPDGGYQKGPEDE